MTRTVYQEAIANAQEQKRTADLPKIHQYRAQLRSITNNLRSLAQAAGRTKISANTLLKECYQLTDAVLDTYDGWAAKGAYVRKGQHAYLFWGKPVSSADGTFKYCPVQFMFTQDQVSFRQAQ